MFLLQWQAPDANFSSPLEALSHVGLGPVDLPIFQNHELYLWGHLAESTNIFPIWMKRLRPESFRSNGAPGMRFRQVCNYPQVVAVLSVALTSNAQRNYGYSTRLLELSR